MATLTFSGANVAAWCGARLGAQLIDAGLLHTMSADAVTARAALSEQFVEAVGTFVTTGLATPDVGVKGTLALLNAVLALLKERSKGVETRRSAAVSDQQRLELDLAGQEEALQEAGHALFLWRNRTLGAARDRYIEAATAALTCQLAVFVYDTALAAMTACDRALRDWHLRLSGIRATLLSAQRQLRAEEQAFFSQHNHRRSVADITLMEPDYCEMLYQRHAPLLPQVVGELLRQHTVVDWDTLSSEALCTIIHGVANAAFANIAAMTVEDALRDQTDAVSPAAQLERLFRLAAPSWNLDLTRLEDGGVHLQNIRVLGVPDEAHSLFASQMQMLVSTHDPSALTAFVATIGAPFSALQQYPDYERAYHTAKRTRALHVLPLFQTEGEQAKLAFALGIVYDLIFNRGVYFYYRPEDVLDAPVKLSSGLANAIHSFAQHDTLVQEVIARVEQHIAEMGTTAAIEKLAAYYNADGQGGRGKSSAGATDPLVLQMRKLVRAYAEELRSAQQAFGTL